MPTRGRSPGRPTRRRSARSRPPSAARPRRGSHRPCSRRRCPPPPVLPRMRARLTRRSRPPPAATGRTARSRRSAAARTGPPPPPPSAHRLPESPRAQPPSAPRLARRRAAVVPRPPQGHAQPGTRPPRGPGPAPSPPTAPAQCSTRHRRSLDLRSRRARPQRARSTRAGLPSGKPATGAGPMASGQSGHRRAVGSVAADRRACPARRGRRRLADTPGQHSAGPTDTARGGVDARHDRGPPESRHPVLTGPPPSSRCEPPGSCWSAADVPRDPLGGLVHEYLQVARHDRVLGTHRPSG